MTLFSFTEFHLVDGINQLQLKLLNGVVNNLEA